MIKLHRKKIEHTLKINCGDEILDAQIYEETLPNGTKYLAAYKKEGTILNTDEFIVPNNHFFFMGDNRDCSNDSRFLSTVGYVSSVNLVGKAKTIFFSNDKKNGNFLKFWNWHKSLRTERFFEGIK